MPTMTCNDVITDFNLKLMSYSKKTHQNNTAYKNFGLLPSKMEKLQGLSDIPQL